MFPAAAARARRPCSAWWTRVRSSRTRRPRTCRGASSRAPRPSSLSAAVAAVGWRALVVRAVASWSEEEDGCFPRCSPRVTAGRAFGSENERAMWGAVPTRCALSPHPQFAGGGPDELRSLSSSSFCNYRQVRVPTLVREQVLDRHGRRGRASVRARRQEGQKKVPPRETGLRFSRISLSACESIRKNMVVKILRDPCSDL